MSGLDAMAVGGVIGLVITGVMWWRIDILPQIRDIRRTIPNGCADPRGDTDP